MAGDLGRDRASRDVPDGCASRPRWARAVREERQRAVSEMTKPEPRRATGRTSIANAPAGSSRVQTRG
jgi:hypothetical protein